MRKILFVLFVGFLLLVPVVGSALTISTGEYKDDVVLTLNVGSGATAEVITGSSTPNYYTDYQSGDVELFCVEGSQSASLNNNETYRLYLLTASEINKKVAYIAEKYWETDKNIAQLAIWKTLEVIDSVYTGSVDDVVDTIIAEANSSSVDYTGFWTIAVNNDYQDYLMRAAPVPEPATLMLLGTGLIGLAGVSRKKFKK